VAQAEQVARNARRTLAKRPGDGRLGRLVGRLDETTAATRRLLDQTRQRLAGNRVIPDGVLSLADPDVRPIRKGKPQRPTEFGYTVLVAECERGFIATHRTHKGNPGDAAQLVPAVTEITTLTGRPPGTVVGDRGFGTAANDQALEALGVRRVGVARKGTPARPAQPSSEPGGSSACATGGLASRPASATSSAPSGWVAPGCAAWPARWSGWGWGSSPTTCSA
jgi:transposase, IS5 family